MNNPIHCDECDRPCPDLETALHTGWSLSEQKSVSGVPMDVMCPKCKDRLKDISFIKKEE